ncbi:D-ribose transporter ATP-binding protein [Pseudomonas sp. Leaf127]|uniref:sugar ABC transporter ATP-binding protein n=1 Tax=Pseudomonas sp. Leaf127 TaxID=1736267 RepID=UPI0007034FBE|nr:sugar ABC transporter ATP-binding protein [Pseudomonas sp. Leaf127]KQQ62351.1 D-ribose transporter ATP-binding protein [Pseudomonas sp. Leaf127]
MSDALLRVRNIKKTFPGVVALNGVQLEVGIGEVHALLGENGAGKSTILKILAGAQPADAGQGTLEFNGYALEEHDTPMRRQALGIITIYQEFNLIADMSVAENMYLGREPVRHGLVDWKKMFSDAQHVLTDLGLTITPKTMVRKLSVAEQQMVEIAKALTMNAKLIIMDEPTAALSGREVDKLHEIIADLKAKGISIIYVSHKLNEVKACCDRYTIFRDGAFITSGEVSAVTVDDIVRLMVGRDVEFVRKPLTGDPGEIMLKVQSVSRASGGDGQSLHATPLRDMSIDVRAGEIVGFAGLVGAGRTELARVIFGADGCDEGIIYVNGRQVSPFKSPREGIAAGVALVPEDRKQQACFLGHSIRWNMSLPSLGGLQRWGLFIDDRAETQLIQDYQKRLRIKMANDNVAIGTLSGGNQQKVILARCMALKPKVLIVDEPTRGIDVGAKAEVHQVLFDMARAGIAVIVISSELPEVMAVSDMIVTFREGAITGVVSADEATEELLMQRMAQGVSSSFSHQAAV